MHCYKTVVRKYHGTLWFCGAGSAHCACMPGFSLSGNPTHPIPHTELKGNENITRIRAIQKSESKKLPSKGMFIV
jgi:hypothetical protein